jgi:hypothetical protein
MEPIFRQVADNATSGTETNLSSIGVTSVQLYSGDGSKFPIPGNGFYLTLWNGADPGTDPNVEKVLVSARSGDVLTVGATANTHISPCNAALLNVSSNITDLQSAVINLEVLSTALAVAL